VNWEEMAVVGRIARSHGIRGRVVVNLETDFPHQRFQTDAKLFARDAAGTVKMLTVTSARFQQGRPVLGLSGVEDMNGAAALAGVELRVPREWLAELPEGTFYRHDLVGCAVETTAGQTIGLVSDVEGPFGSSRLVVTTAGGDVLVPLVAAICTTVDPVHKRIVVAPPEGLLELNTKATDRK
jgi:16S rRNA processing protein RimM